MKKLTCLLLSLIICAVSLTVPAFADNADNSFTTYLMSQFEARVEEINISEYTYKYGWNIDTLKSKMEMVFYQASELIYVDMDNVSIYSNPRDNVPVVVSFSYNMSKSAYETAIKKMKSVAEKVIEGLSPGMTDLDKALYVHDYLILNCAYDSALDHHTAYDCLVKKSSVCQGYALAYKYIMNDLLGIKCTTVYSDTQNHIWNYIRIGGKWYHVDVTADDPVFKYKSSTYDRLGLVTHDNFLMSDARCKEIDPLHSDWIVIGDYPAATDKSYDKAFWTDINSKICYDNGTYYYASDGGVSGNKKVVKICSRNVSTGKTKTLVMLKSNWFAVRDLSGATFEYGKKSYISIWSSLELINGKLYFNSNKCVYSYNLSTKKYKKIYTLNKGDEQQIFGLVSVNGNIRLAYKKDQTYAESYLKLVLK